MPSGGKTGEEIERTSIRVRQREESHEARSFESDATLKTIPHVSCQCIQRGNHTLAETSGAGGIVDRTDLVIAALVEMQVFGPISVRMFCFVFLCDGVVVNLLRIQSQGDRMPVIQADSSQHLRNLIKVDSLPVDITDEEQFRAGMVDNVNSIVCTEVLENRNDNSTISDSSKENGYPVTVITSHDGDLVVLLNTALFEEYVQFLHVDSQLAICQGDVRTIVSDGRHLPVLFERALIHLDKIVFFFGHHND